MFVSSRLVPHSENLLESHLHDETEEEEEVWLYWIDHNKEPHGKTIRHLAQDAKGNHKDDTDNMTYYRFAFFTVGRTSCHRTQRLTVQRCHRLVFDETCFCIFFFYLEIYRLVRVQNIFQCDSQNEKIQGLKSQLK